MALNHMGVPSLSHSLTDGYLGHSYFFTSINNAVIHILSICHPKYIEHFHTVDSKTWNCWIDENVPS